jgi:hypothetical protein
MGKFSFKGYSFVEWAKKNKNDLKMFFAIVMTLVSSSVTNIQVGALVGIVSKLGVDAIDYFLSE